jgi:hypothetical protein
MAARRAAKSMQFVRIGLREMLALLVPNACDALARLEA